MHNGAVMTYGEFAALELIPPLHPNCGCELVPAETKRYNDSSDIYSDERFKTNNPIVYESLKDLTQTWFDLDALEKDPNTPPEVKAMIPLMKADVHELANKVREIGDSMTVNWTAFDKIVTGANKISATEMVLYISDRGKGWAVFSAAFQADIIYGKYYEDGSLGNAKLHAYWSAYSVNYTGDSEYVRLFTNAHEYGKQGNFTTELSYINGVPMYQNSIMDLHNNAVGIKIGIASLSLHPVRWPRDERAYIKNQINKSKDLVVIK